MAPGDDQGIARNRLELGVPVCLGVGGSLEFLAGGARRAAAGIQRLGLEWLHRLMWQPWRVRRIVTATLEFPLAVLRRSRRPSWF